MGRLARLHGEDLRRGEGQLKRGSGPLGYSRWTVRRVAALIERVCRVKYDPSQPRRIFESAEKFLELSSRAERGTPTSAMPLL